MKKKTLESIIKYEGNCLGTFCSDCPLRNFIVGSYPCSTIPYKNIKYTYYKKLKYKAATELFIELYGADELMELLL